MLALLLLGDITNQTIVINSTEITKKQQQLTKTTIKWRTTVTRFLVKPAIISIIYIINYYDYYLYPHYVIIIQKLGIASPSKFSQIKFTLKKKKETNKHSITTNK